MHRFRRNSTTSSSALSSSRTALWAIEHYSDLFRQRHALRVLVCCQAAGLPEQQLLAHRAPQHSYKFVSVSAASPTLQHFMEARCALFDTLVVDLIPQPDWAEAILRAWPLLSPGGRLIALARKSWDRAATPHARAAHVILDRFGHRSTPSWHARRAGIPADTVVFWCTRPGSRALAMQNRPMWSEE
ncbi:hypothetical protein [Amycolatopsis jejuensis]|uniref:hypothetical protein n=1 Tax=Amycolatopsis jejuensis TaxID=330084 RepID=UPI00138E4BC7|nr:hypothetical protein [Amycolatopsis jejuensis]